MFANLTTRGALTATTALVALGLVIALPQMTNRPLPDLFARPKAQPHRNRSQRPPCPTKGKRNPMPSPPPRRCPNRSKRARRWPILR